MKGRHNTPAPGGSGGGGGGDATHYHGNFSHCAAAWLHAHLSHEGEWGLLHCLGIADVGFYHVVEWCYVSLHSTQGGQNTATLNRAHSQSVDATTHTASAQHTALPSPPLPCKASTTRQPSWDDSCQEHLMNSGGTPGWSSDWTTNRSRVQDSRFGVFSPNCTLHTAITHVISVLERRRSRMITPSEFT